MSNPVDKNSSSSSVGSFQPVSRFDTETSCHGRIWTSFKKICSKVVDKIKSIFKSRITDDFTHVSTESSTSSEAGERTLTPRSRSNTEVKLPFLEKDKLAFFENKDLSDKELSDYITIILKNVKRTQAEPELTWEQVLDQLWEPKANELAKLQISAQNFESAKSTYLTLLLAHIANAQMKKTSELKNNCLELKGAAKRRLLKSQIAIEEFQLNGLLEVLKNNRITFRVGLNRMEGWMGGDPKVQGKAQVLNDAKDFFEKHLQIHTISARYTPSQFEQKQAKEKAANTEAQKTKNSHDEPVINRKVQVKNAPFGLSNIGNSCYMNASLQALMNIPAVRDRIDAKLKELLDKKTAKSIKKDEEANLALIQNLKNLADLKDIGSIDGVLPDRIFKAAVKAGFGGRSGRQEDAQEFINIALVALDWPTFKSQTITDYTDIKGDKQRNIRKDDHTMLTVEIHKDQDNLQQVVENINTKDETMDDGWVIKERSAKDKNDAVYDKKAKKTVNLTGAAPDALFVHLKRFVTEERIVTVKTRRNKVKEEKKEVIIRKEDKAIKLPADGVVDLSNVFTDPSKSAKYRIVAKVNHHGAYGSGHYTADVLNYRDTKDPRWINCNDSSISTSSNFLGKEDDQGYVLVLERIKT